MNPSTHRGEPVRRFRSGAEWARWLAKNHARSTAVWVQYAKKGSGIQSVTYAEAVEEALCFGWIDGQAASFDDTYYLQRFTPRRRKSRWSKINVAKAEALIASGRMLPSGLREVEAARADGRWADAYSSPRAAKVPDDFAKELDTAPKAREFFTRLDAQNRYAILHRLEAIKGRATRERRIAAFVAMLAEGRAIHPVPEKRAQIPE